MLTFSSSIHAVKQWEKYCDDLVKIGLADNYKEPVDGHGTSSSGYNLEKAYQLFVRPHGLDEGGRVNVRFWYDERTNEQGFKKDEASVKFSPKGLTTILNSLRVATILSKHNIKLMGSDGKVDLKALTEAARLIDKDITAIQKISEEKFEVKTKEE